MEEGGGRRDGEQAPGPGEGRLRRRRARRNRKKSNGDTAGQGSASEPHGSRDGDTVGGHAVQAAPPRAGEETSGGGGRGGLNGEAGQERSRLSGPEAGSNGDEEDEEQRPDLGRVQPLQSGDQKGGGLDVQLGDHNGEAEQKRLRLGGQAPHQQGAGGPGAHRGKDGNGRAPASNPVRGGEDGMIGGNGEVNSNGGRGSEGRRGGDDGNVARDRLGLAASLGVTMPGGSGQPAPMGRRRGGVPVPPQPDGGGGGSAAATSQQLATGAVELAAAPIAPRSKLLEMRSTFLSDAVLSWTVSDVLNENLYRDQVQQIPIKFESHEHYANVYSTLLLEETRAILCSDIHNIVDREYCQLVAVTSCGSPSLYYLDIALKETSSDPINCHHIAKDFDVCLLSLTPPRDSHFNIKSCYLGLATDIGRDTFYQRSFKVAVSTGEMFQPEKIKFVSFLTNIGYKLKISKALSLCDESDKTAVQAVPELFQKVAKRCDSCGPSHNCKNVVAALSSRLCCQHQPHTEVVFAPPGTLNGCVPTLLKESLRLSQRVLICIPKEDCLPEFLINLDDLVGTSSEFAGLLLLNSVAGLRTCSKFEKACLENKAQEVYCCLEQCTGQLKWLSSLLDLEAFNHSPRCPDATKCEKCRLQFPFSIQLFTERFTDILMKLRDSLCYLVNNASALCLPGEDSKNILELMQLMKKVEDSLRRKDLTDEGVIVAFGLNLYIPGAASMNNAYHTAEILNETRMSCVRLIDKLLKSLKLPHLENRDALDRFCIQHSSIIVAPLDCMEKLHDQEMKTFDILIVTGSSQITDSDLLVPLGLDVGHIFFFGDHLHLQRFVQSKICKEAGFDRSIYERLQQSTSEKLTLTHQYVRHPALNEFISNLFYNESIMDGPSVISMEYKNEFRSLGLPIVSFMDVLSVESKSIHSGKCYINFAAIVMLLRQLSADRTDADEKLCLGLVCLSNDEVNAVEVLLRNEKEINDRFHLEVKFVGNLKGELFDVIIIPSIVEDLAELNCVNANSLNVALSSSRHYCVMIGDHETLSQSRGVWKKVSEYMRDRDLIITVDINALTEVMNKLETNVVDMLSGSAHLKKLPGQERTWDGRPFRTKPVLADVRDQRGQADSCVLQATSGAGDSMMKHHNASLTPPRDCRLKLSVDDFKKKHEKGSGKKFTAEDIADRGKRRLVTAFEKFKEHGVEGRNKCQTKVVRLSAYKEIVADSKVNPKSTDDVKDLLEMGNVLVGSFKLSMNYFNLRPGEIYVFDDKKPIKHSKSNLMASHAVMMIGIGHTKTPRDRYFRHMGMQNSEGRLFGINGLGRVAKTSVKDLFQIELEKPGLEPF